MFLRLLKYPGIKSIRFYTETSIDNLKSRLEKHVDELNKEAKEGKTKIDSEGESASGTWYDLKCEIAPDQSDTIVQKIKDKIHDLKETVVHAIKSEVSDDAVAENNQKTHDDSENKFNSITKEVRNAYKCFKEGANTECYDTNEFESQEKDPLRNKPKANQETFNDDYLNKKNK